MTALIGGGVLAAEGGAASAEGQAQASRTAGASSASGVPNEAAPEFGVSLAHALLDPTWDESREWAPAEVFRSEGRAMAAGMLDMPEGRLAVYALLPPSPRATILFVHGYLSEAAAFAPLIKHFAGEGFAVLAFDLPGHGHSYGARFTVGSFHEYGDAVLAVARASVGLPRPLIGLGHSLGGLSLADASLRAEVDSSPPFDSLLLVAPLTRSSWWPVVHAIAELPHEGDGPLPFSKVPNSWVLGLAAWRTWAEEAVPSQVPALILLAGRDTATDPADAGRLLGRLFPKARMETLDWMGHWEIEKARPDSRLLGSIDGFLGEISGGDR
ncbi:MAG TPA: alpha/beta fold hydrolase [Rectinemataceae bacterium]|nr:alpha/beta fold hydrolase [Rectinemataceae bacterium]